ncbi:MAG: GFA family protein [Pseudomonadota bacterium]
MSDMLKGRCLCGDVRFEVEPPIMRCVNCHCESCRRACSAPMASYFGAPDGQWRWTRGAPKSFESSPGVQRRFCGRCGAPLSFRSATLSDVIHFYTASLDDPEALTPTSHFFYSEKLPWLHVGDELPKYEGNGA